MREAQYHLAKLIKEVEAGEEIILTKRGVKTAKIVPYREPAPRKVTMPDFRAMRKRIGTDQVTDGVNEVLYLRELDDERSDDLRRYELPPESLYYRGEHSEGGRGEGSGQSSHPLDALSSS